VVPKVFSDRLNAFDGGVGSWRSSFAQGFEGCGDAAEVGSQRLDRRFEMVDASLHYAGREKELMPKIGVWEGATKNPHLLEYVRDRVKSAAGAGLPVH
jgi:hypothetical protein